MNSYRSSKLLFLCLFASPCFAEDVVTASDIVSQLTRPPAPVFKSMPKAPDPVSHACQINLTLPPATQASFRNLYTEATQSTDLDVMFEYGSASLLTDGKRQLDELAKALKNTDLREAKFALAGHTDAQGSADFNDKLSCARALAAREYLLKKHNILPDRIIPLGFGMTMLKNPADPGAGENRRVEVRRLPNS